MNNDILEIERKKLKEVLEEYKVQIEELNLKLATLIKTRGNQNNIDSILEIFYSKLNLLKRSLEKPYFARIDFISDDEKNMEQCYIGKVGVVDENNKIITVDWRAPISSLYYDSNIGKASYEAPEGIISGRMTIKRQYNIEHAILNNYQDVDIVSNDDILKPYLGVNADSRLKNIVASIQSEQNQIIREKMNKNLIIQGVAGSGKTTVALHRIAYLVYNNIQNIKPNQYMVIGPNQFFLNYISTVLPDLDVENVSQLTYDQLASQFLGENFELNSYNDKLKGFISGIENPITDSLKTSMNYKMAIDNYMDYFDSTVVPRKDFTIKGFTILTQEQVENIYNQINKEYYCSIKSRVERACLLLSKQIENNEETILERLTKKVHFIYTQSQSNQAKMTQLYKDVEFVKKEVLRHCNQSLKKHFSKSSTKILSMYGDFIKNIEKFAHNIDDDSLKKIKEMTGENLKQKKFDFEDMAGLLYLKYKLSGVSDYSRFKHVVVDEAQDFGEFNFYVLKQIMPNSTFSIFGDLAQSIYDYRSIKDWNTVISTTFNSNCDIRQLLKSYRTTTEIMNSANNIIEHIGLNPSIPVIRHGSQVKLTNLSLNKYDKIIASIKKYLEMGYGTIAVIGKTEDDANQLYSNLLNNGFPLNNIIASNTKYTGGVCTITSYLAKGLEFDAVIISNASEYTYSSSSVTDMKLLYVAMTRALHELEVFYQETITEPLKNENE